MRLSKELLGPEPRLDDGPGSVDAWNVQSWDLLSMYEYRGVNSAHLARMWSEWAVTVAFSDSDSPGAGQQTLVATSQLQWGDPDTFGALVRFPGDARFPPMVSAVAFPLAF